MSSPLDIKNYLIDPAGKDWSSLLSGWSDVLPSKVTVWLVNKFGDVFLALDDGSINLLEVATATLTRLADDRDDFCNKIDQDGNAMDWLMIPLVDQLTAMGMIADADQCYTFKISPLFKEGTYDVGNVGLISLVEQYSFLSDLYRQTKNLPDGTTIEMKVIRPRAN